MNPVLLPWGSIWAPWSPVEAKKSKSPGPFLPYFLECTLHLDLIIFVKLGIVAGYESCEFYSCQYNIVFYIKISRRLKTFVFQWKTSILLKNLIFRKAFILELTPLCMGRLLLPFLWCVLPFVYWKVNWLELGRSLNSHMTGEEASSEFSFLICELRLSG